MAGLKYTSYEVAEWILVCIALGPIQALFSIGLLCDYISLERGLNRIAKKERDNNGMS